MVSEKYYFEDGRTTSSYYCAYMDDANVRLCYLFNHPKHEIVKSLMEKFKVKRMFDICRTPMQRGEQPDYDDKGDVLVVKTIDLNNSHIDYGSCLRTTKEFFNKVPNAQVKRGDILIASTGYGSLGKVDLFEYEGDAVVDSHITILRPIDNYDTTFVIYYLRSLFGRLQFEKWFSGSSGQIEIQPNDLNQFIIPESSSRGVDHKKQIEIVMAVRKKLNIASELDRQIDELIMKTETLLLTNLGVGTPIITKVNYYAHNFVDVKDRLDIEYNNPKYNCIETVISDSDVNFVELRDVVDIVVDATNPLERPNEPFMYADIGNIDTKWGRISAIEMFGYQATSSRMRRLMHKGEIVVSTTRPTRNAIAIVPDELDGGVCSTGLAVLKCKKSIENKFLFHSLRTTLSNIQFQKHCSGSGYPEINQEMDLPRIKIPKPDLPKQKELIQLLENNIKLAEKKEADANMLRHEANSIFEEAIMK